MNGNYLYEGADEYLARYLTGSTRAEKLLGFQMLQNAVVLPHLTLENGAWGGGIVTAEGDYLENTAVHNKSGCAYAVDDEQVENADETVIYLGMFNGVWGHCITDNIRRCWFLMTDEYARKYSNAKFIYIPIIGFKMHSNFLKLLNILGIKEEQLIPVTKATRFANIVLPDESFFTEDGDTRLFTKEYVDTIDRIVDYANSRKTETGIEKVYLTFSKSPKMTGEEALERFFQKNGYAIIDFGQIGLDEQLNILINCRYLAGTLGSNMHNAVFCNEGTNVILIPRSYYIPGYQAAINEARKLNAVFIDSTLSDGVENTKPYMGPFFSYVSRELKSYFGDSSRITSREALDSLRSYYHYKADSRFTGGRCDRTAPAYYEARVKEQIKEWEELARGEKGCRSIRYLETVKLYRNILVRRIKALTRTN